MVKRVPELSLAAYTEGDRASRRGFSEAFLQGLQDYGFIILTDHGAPTRLLERAYVVTDAASSSAARR